MAWAVALLGIKMEGCLRQAPPQSVKLILVQVRMPVGSRTLSMLSFFHPLPSTVSSQGR